jgi:cardiolipin synthase A/B
VDGEIAFTGGMNIADYHMVTQPRVRKPVQDVHFRLRGPVVAQLAAVFAEDWRVATREALPLPPVPQAYRDGAMCRVITDGPDEDVDKLELILVAAISQARHRVCIMTPYFIPSHELASAMKAAALRGVEVDIVLPQRSNLRFVDWATRHQLAPLLQHGVRVHQQAPPFAHSKLLVVDDAYAQIGTANIDPRSLRLNFELAVEIYDAAVAAALAAPIDAARENGVPVTLAALNGRRLPARLRDAFFWLFSPYL